jgi:hypothetical protein
MESFMERLRPEQLSKDWVVQFLTGESVPSDIERDAIAAFSRDADWEDRREAEIQAEWNRISAESRAVRRAVTDDRIAKVQAPLRAAIKKWHEHKLVVPVVEPEEASLSIGSLSATRVPPYEFSWTAAKEDGPANVDPQVNKKTGSLLSDVSAPSVQIDWSKPWDASWGRAWSAVGIFFQPKFDGVLKVSSTPPSVSIYWYTAASNAQARSAAKAGIRVYRFVSGTRKQDPADRFLTQNSNPLWDDRIDADLFQTSGDGPVSDEISPALTCGPFSVSKEFFYNLWVYFKTAASSDGADLLSASSAQAAMSGVVTSIKWTLS